MDVDAPHLVLDSDEEDAVITIDNDNAPLPTSWCDVLLAYLSNRVQYIKDRKVACSSSQNFHIGFGSWTYLFVCWLLSIHSLSLEVISYGDDCSGARSPLFALNKFFRCLFGRPRCI